ncbi:hypothetical protein V2J09_010665 [Rumex salicifolius]
MSSQRHLKELLREDQEPFHIAHQKCHLKKQPSLKQMQLTKKKKPSQNASFHSNFCKNACLFSSSSAFQVDSPDYRKSPLLSPAALGSKSPSRAMLLHVPAKTAALLLEAACRIQRNSMPNAKPKSRSKSSGFGLLGSVIKRLTNRTRTPKLDLVESDSDVIRWADSVKSGGSSRRPSVCGRDGIRIGSVEKSDLVEDRTGFSNGRLSSVWSEENKSLASSSSSSSTCCSRTASGNLSEEEEKIGFQNENARNINEDFTFCLSPLSPFRFALQKSPSPGRRSPAFCSPAASPSRRKFQENENYEQQNSSVKFEVEEEEEKEQSSPVSILDPPFGDDDCEEEEDRGECHGDDDKFDMECSFAFVQRAKQQLLQKLRKFERLADLDPIELEKRMVEEEEEDGEYDEDLEYEADVEDDVERSTEYYLAEIGMRSGLVHDLVNPGMKKLLSDLISEESFGDDYECLVKRVCERLELWNEVDPNTIEMMVAMDLKGEDDTWQNRGEEISQTAKMVELSIFAGLLDELIMMS